MARRLQLVSLATALLGVLVLVAYRHEITGVRAQTPIVYQYTYDKVFDNMQNTSGFSWSKRIMEAQAADGSHAHLETKMGTTSGFVNRTLYLANGDSVEVSDPIKMKVTHHRTAASFAASRQYAPQASNSCVSTRAGDIYPLTVAPDTFANLPVFRLEVRLPGESGHTMHITRYLSQGLGCAELGRTEDTLDADGTTVVKKMSTIPVQLLTTAPPSSYFAVPADYAEGPPSAINIAWARYMGVADPPPAMMWEALDKKYYAEPGR
jgi:hypothetical protein